MGLQNQGLLTFANPLHIFTAIKPKPNHMKKIFTLLFAIAALSIAGNAQNVCTVDNNNTQFGITPNDTTAPPVVRGSLFDTVAQIYVPATYTINYMGTPATITINWIVIDTVTAFPTGVSYQRNPGSIDTIYGGQHQCIRISGTTMDTVGIYNLVFTGTVKVTIPILGVKTYTIAGLDSLASQNGGGQAFGYFLKVNGGVGINNVGSNFNSSLNVYPNPTNGTFELSLTNIDKVNGDINVYDMTGRKVYSRKVDATGFYTTSIDLSGFAKGLYTVQVRTENGVASKNISVE